MLVDVDRVAAREQEHRRLRLEPACDERQHIQRLDIEQSGVVDDAQHRGVLASGSQQSQDTEPDQEAVRRRPFHNSCRHTQRLLLP